MKIAIGNDHAAVKMKQEILAYLQELGHEVTNYGRILMRAATIPNMAKSLEEQLRRES